MSYCLKLYHQNTMALRSRIIQGLEKKIPHQITMTYWNVAKRKEATKLFCENLPPSGLPSTGCRLGSSMFSSHSQFFFDDKGQESNFLVYRVAFHHLNVYSYTRMSKTCKQWRNRVEWSIMRHFFSINSPGHTNYFKSCPVSPTSLIFFVNACINSWNQLHLNA